MRKFKILYSDRTMSERAEKFETVNTYARKEAEEMTSVLATLGCTDFEIVPVKEAA